MPLVVEGRRLADDCRRTQRHSFPTQLDRVIDECKQSGLALHYGLAPWVQVCHYLLE